MEHRQLGASGLRVSVVGLGCNNFGGRLDVEGTRKVVDAAIESGITLFDTADIYGNRGGSESALGEVLGQRRKDIVLATKFGGAMDEAGILKGASRRYLVGAVDASLRRLRTDWIDLYQLHFPDPLTPIEETLRALDDLVRQGKVRYIGCSNFAAWQVADAQWIARTHELASFISCQNEYSLLERGPDRELIPAMQHFSLGLLPYFPLASGMLSGKYVRGQPPPAGTRMHAASQLAQRYFTDAHWDVIDCLTEFCAARGHSLLDLAFGWLLARPTVASVIAGAMKAEQVAQNVRAGQWQLNAQELAEIDRITAQDVGR